MTTRLAHKRVNLSPEAYNDRSAPMALGSFVEPGDHEKLVFREYFLNAVRDHAPPVLEALAFGPFPTYLRILPPYIRRCVKGNSDYLEFRAAYDAALCTWATRYQLHTPWLLREAFATLIQWISTSGYDPRADPQRRWAPLLHLIKPTFPEDGSFWQLRLSHWDPMAGPPMTEQRRLWLKQFNAQVARYFKKRETYALKVKGLRKAPGPKKLKHFEWVVRHMVLRESYGDIAGNDVPASTVAAAIKSLATLLDLPAPQPAPSGRPRGVQESRPRIRP